MGKTQNRRFYNIPHAKLIQMLRYKCYEKGILVLTTEESYTSITSFMNNCELKTFEDKNNSVAVDNSKKNILEQYTSTTKEKHNYGGKRDQKNRHDYVNDNTTNNTTDLENSIESIENGQIMPENGINNKIHDKVKAENENLGSHKSKIIIHADHNGSYHMIGKVVVGFKYDKTKHSHKNDIYTMFGKRNGLTKIKTKVMARVATRANVEFDFVNDQIYLVNEVS